MNAAPPTKPTAPTGPRTAVARAGATASDTGDWTVRLANSLESYTRAALETIDHATHPHPLQQSVKVHRCTTMELSAMEGGVEPPEPVEESVYDKLRDLKQSVSASVDELAHHSLWRREPCLPTTAVPVEERS